MESWLSITFLLWQLFHHLHFVVELERFDQALLILSPAVFKAQKMPIAFNSVKVESDVIVIKLFHS